MRKLRIAFFSDMLTRDHDGCMRTVFHILDRKPETVDFKFFTGKDAVKGLGQEYVAVPEFRLPFNKSYNMALPTMVADKIHNALDEFEPDVIHITSPSRLGQFAQNYAISKGVPVSTIYHTHFLSYMDYYFSKAKLLMPMAKRFVTQQTRKFYNNCDLVLVPTEVMREELECIGVQSDRMKIWRRGLDHEIFNPRQDSTNMLQEITGNKKPNLLFASRLVWEKNLKTLIKIYDQIKAEGDQYNLLIAGDGVAEMELKVKMPDAVFLGKLPQEALAKLYASADVFVFPSVSETYGNVVVEAMASGLPCVVANGGGSASFITNGVNGYAVEPYESTAYLEKVKLLMTYPEHKSSVIGEGLKYTKDLSWDSLVKSFYEKLESLWKDEIGVAA